MKTIYLTFFSAALLIVSCNGKPQSTVSTAPDSTMQTPADTVRAYNYFGTYEGTLPAADCEGIKTQITLNEDTTYDLLEEYPGKGDRPRETCGVYHILKNDIVELVEPSSDNRTYYKIIENALVLSDSVGTINQGELADFYVLKRK